MLKKQFTNGWTQVPNTIINHVNLTFKAKGLWMYINSKPEGWDFAVWRIAKETKEGEKAVRSGLRDLHDLGYLGYRAKYKDNQLAGQEYILYDIPEQGTPKPAPPKTSTSQNGIDYNKKDLNKKLLSNKELESTQKIQDFKNNPNFPKWRAIDFPDLTDEQLELAIETYLSDYPKAKTTSIVGYLTDYNKKHKKPNWVKAKESEVVYQENVEKAKEDSDSDSQAYGNLLSMDEALQEPQREEIDPRIEELTKNIKKRLQNGGIKLSDYPVLNPSLFKSVMKTPLEQQVAFFVAIEKQALTKAKN
jgi:hypothetical protein